VDFAIAALALMLTAPLWPLIAFAIRLDSPGPALFRQLRVGRSLPDRTELFVMLKFRSMRQDAEAGTGPVWAQARDSRVTRLGRLLRRSRLDELPQLINVLRGDMSIIGPRPERPGITAGLARALPHFPARTCGIRPGITGLAQVSQGYDTCLDDVRRKLAFDQHYARRLSFLRDWFVMDVSIALRTVLVMARGHAH
jgi:lipopolysaccharide/colanic/teichoic acid biosynthesis glycosyltransferase